jgi:hypothetical protein
MRMIHCRGVGPAAFALCTLACPASGGAQESRESRPATLVYGALIGLDLQVAYGAPYRYSREDPTRFPGEFGISGSLQLLSAGVGRMRGRNGLLLAVRGLEVAPSGRSGDYLLAAATLPVYLYGVRTFGAHAEGRAPAVITAFVGGATWVAYDMPYLQAGIGVKRRVGAFSPQAQFIWRRQSYDDGRRRHYISVGVGVELGGIWRLESRRSRKANAR